MNITDKVYAAHNALDNNDIAQAEQLIAEAELEASAIQDPIVLAQIRANIGGVLIDLGAYQQNESTIIRGIEFTNSVLATLPQDQLSTIHHYNAANGYSALWQIRVANLFDTGVVEDAHIKSKSLHRQALARIDSNLDNLAPRPHARLLVNYANCLDTVGRVVEAVELYDRALTIDPSLGEALGNKAIALERFAFLAQGNTHLFLIESHRLYTEALQQQLPAQAAAYFQKHLDSLSEFMRAHGPMEPEVNTSPQPSSPFHKFLIEFCVRHQLYLTPTTFIGKERAVIYGDPIFITGMIAPLGEHDKFDRYITFLNQIKQDYVLARYFLVQSQYHSEVIDVVDRDVTLYYPLDYSLHSTYIQLMKASLKAAADVLDKIAFFVRDYCQVTTIQETRVDFQSLWADRNSPGKLRPELAAKENLFLYAFLDMALDLRNDGYYGFINGLRNALTHRYLVVHDMLLSRQANSDIPRIELDDFLKDCISAMKLVRAAVMYLIAFVQIEEERASEGERTGSTYGTLVDETFRWVPPQGE